MKRIQAACITQTLHFLLKEDMEKEYAKQYVLNEVEKYKSQLKQRNTRFKILSEEIQPDGSVVIEIKKQYNNSPCGHYLD